LVAALEASGQLGGSKGNVSKKLDRLQDLALVELASQTKAGKVYRHTNSDRILRITTQLTRRLNDRARKEKPKVRSDRDLS
jgi:DNA-binding transcriptional regulator GbsR (MarR family)